MSGYFFRIIQAAIIPSTAASAPRTVKICAVLNSSALHDAMMSTVCGAVELIYKSGGPIVIGLFILPLLSFFPLPSPWSSGRIRVLVFQIVLALVFR